MLLPLDEKLATPRKQRNMPNGYFSQQDGLGRVLAVLTVALALVSLVLYFIGPPERRFGSYLLIAAAIFGFVENVHRRRRQRRSGINDRAAQ